MEDTIRVALARWRDRQPNMASEAFRNGLADEIAILLREKGSYIVFTDSEIEEQNARATWVCSICGENTADVDYDYIGSGTNHLGCELKSQEDIDEYIEDIDEQAYAQGRGSSHRVVDDAGVDIETGKYVGDGKIPTTEDDGRDLNFIHGSEEIDGMYTDDEVKGWEEAVGYKEPELKFDTITEELYTDEPHEELPFREKNWLQKKHEDKVFGHDQGGSYTISAGEEVDGMYFDDEVKEWEEAVGYKEPVQTLDDGGGITYRDKVDLQKQIYTEMTSDGLPEGGDAQAVLESHKLADEIVDNQKGKWIYESPDGGKTVFRRPFSDYDPKNKEEIDWETKEPTGRKFTEYNNGNWRSETPYYDAAHNINNEKGHEE